MKAKFLPACSGICILSLGLVLLISFLVISACSNQKSEDETVSWMNTLQKKQGTLTALYVPAEGFAFPDESGNLTGVTVDLLRIFSGYVKSEHDVDLRIHFVEEPDWRTFYRRIAEGRDGLIGMGNVTITEARKSELRFSPPYMTNIAALITHPDAADLKSLADLGETFKGLNALAFTGTLHEERLQKLTERYYPDAEIYPAVSNDEIIERISSRNEFFAYIDIYNVHRAMSRGVALKRHEVGDEAAEIFGYIMPHHSTWGEIVDEWFHHNGGLINSEAYQHIMRKHLGDHLAGILLEANQSADN